MREPRLPSEATLQHCGIPRRYWQRSLGLPALVPTGYARGLARYLERIPLLRKRGTGLVIYGEQFRCAEHGLSALLQGAMSRGYRCYTVRADALQAAAIEHTAATHDEWGDPVSVLAHARSVDFLWISGVELLQGNEFARQTLAGIVRNRYDDMSPTFLSATALGAFVHLAPDVRALLSNAAIFARYDVDRDNAPR